MSLQKVNTRNMVLILIIVATAALRLLSFYYPVLSNFTPVGAIAIFGGAYFTDKWKAYLVPLLVLFFSDIAINYLYTSKVIFFHSSSIYLYLCFAVMVMFGTFIKKVTFGKVLMASLASVAVHWLVMDLPFLYGSQYTHDLSGYIKSLTLALPFERNMLFGDAIYGGILFGGFELAKGKYHILRSKKELAI